MRVRLINTPEDILGLLYTGATTCYKSGSVIDNLDSYIPKEKKLNLIENCIKSGHHSVLEHVNFTFVIEGVSRALTHQLVRHRHASYSQQSQRYCDAANCDFIVPDGLSKEAYVKIGRVLNQIRITYSELLEMGVKKEDARCILPNCTSSTITMTLNLRELMHICHERLCTRAQLEIRQLITLMQREVCKRETWLAPYLQAKCEMLGYCPEDKGCGRKQNK